MGPIEERPINKVRVDLASATAKLFTTSEFLNANNLVSIGQTLTASMTRAAKSPN